MKRNREYKLMKSKFHLFTNTIYCILTNYYIQHIGNKKERVNEHEKTN